MKEGQKLVPSNLPQKIRSDANVGLDATCPLFWPDRMGAVVLALCPSTRAEDNILALPHPCRRGITQWCCASAGVEDELCDILSPQKDKNADRPGGHGSRCGAIMLP